MLSELTRRHYDPSYSGMPWLTENLITFPLYNFDGKLIGYQRYNPLGVKKSHSIKDAKYFTHVTNGYSAIWGVESLTTESPFVVVCEGIFKACRFHPYGIPALAVLGKNPVRLREQLQLLNLTTTVVAIPDPDSAGLELLEVIPTFLIPPLSVDELSTSQMDNLVAELTTKFSTS